MACLDALVASRQGGLGVVWGRRRVGKTRLLVEWCRKHRGLYTVADQSAAVIQRHYLAESVASVLPGFHEVQYPDWGSLLSRLAREAVTRDWHGPVVLDEFPYLAVTSPELPSVLQRWLDHEAIPAGVAVVLAGSSQRMMQGLVLDGAAPLYGRARVTMALQPVGAGYIQEALDLSDARQAVEAYTAWGGTPWFWELAAPHGPAVETAIERCVLDPMSPLHSEPDRFLAEEMPPALSLRPILDAIGMGAHRGSEIAARMGCASTSLSRALVRLQALGLVDRELPFGDSEMSGKRALYRIADPFFRLWFRVVASHRAWLVAAPPQGRVELWRQARPALTAETWEELCRACIAKLTPDLHPLAKLGPWTPARRFWHGSGPEWDVVSRSLDGQRLLLGEVKWLAQPASADTISAVAAELTRKGRPATAAARQAQLVNAVFVPDVEPNAVIPPNLHVLDAKSVLAALR
ncbi:MAG: hypothetical protein A3K19_28365 [Lentisphaerae bacterium RIFOXYB12_FULL_65_16]|nr:MAG: hypothetical protein A3K18_19615 [Lentisphaerae bacterium RIFOXYA12_64_32]OGV85502.1 MAG: hypothetical protein A3K19_28365 [Lentisphaerae bacterium RIFOXYB12_FULL_65_16]